MVLRPRIVIGVLIVVLVACTSGTDRAPATAPSSCRRRTDTTGCAYVTWRGGPRATRVMIDEGRIARVEVDSANVATAAGARVGGQRSRIQQLYPGRVKVTPHKYVDGHYLTVNAADDSSFAIVFETEKGKVTRYRVGRRPAVEYAEGCA